MDPVFYLLAAVVAGWIVQLFLTYKQSMAFNEEVRKLRVSGRVSVGVAGRRYRGGRAFVAIAVDESGVIRDAIMLRGWTTFARARPLPGLLDLRTSVVTGSQELPGVSRTQREAARQAVELLKVGGSRTPSDARV
ncbi:transcriptional regulator GutM [Nocardioides sp.]|uniref:transcriptional regulator GutM n=1 Tax=Nocardioides sp. TaxID=35761 RepID=UPI003D13BE6F